MEQKEYGKNDWHDILLWGALWGIFEATAGYLLHLISFGMGWLVWYPVACFFMANVYRATNKISSILWMGLLCSSIKLLNLMLPGRIDKVVNPSVSIVLEAAAMAAAICVFQQMKTGESKSLLQKAAMVLFMNTGWRLLYLLYLLFIVPDWMREISVVAVTGKCVNYFVVQNLMTGVFITAGYHFKGFLLRPVLWAEQRLCVSARRIPLRLRLAAGSGAVCALLGADIALQFFLS